MKIGLDNAEFFLWVYIPIFVIIQWILHYIFLSPLRSSNIDVEPNYVPYFLILIFFSILGIIGFLYLKKKEKAYNKQNIC